MNEQQHAQPQGKILAGSFVPKAHGVSDGKKCLTMMPIAIKTANTTKAV